MIEEAINHLLEQEEGLYDFGDGNGFVPANRHQNPDGTLGGWVADTANVDDTSHVDYEAQVFGSAEVVNGSEIQDRALVSGRSFVDSAIVREAVVTDEATVRNNALVTTLAEVYEDATVEGPGTIVEGDVHVSGEAVISGGSHVTGLDIHILGRAKITDGARVLHESKIGGEALVQGAVIHKAAIFGKVIVRGGAQVRARIEIKNYGQDVIVIEGENTVIRTQEDLTEYLVQYFEKRKKLFTSFSPSPEEITQDLFFDRADELGYEPTLWNLEDFMEWLEVQGIEDVKPSDLEGFILRELKDWAESVE